MELLISTPVRKGELMIGKLFPYFFLGLLDLFLAVTMAKWVFDVPFRGSMALLLVLSSIYIVVALALGLTISTMTRTQLLANQMAMVIGFLPTFLLSGFTFVISSMPLWLQIITYGIAPRYYVALLKDIFLKGLSFSFLWRETLVLIGMAIVGLWVAAKTFKKEVEVNVPKDPISLCQGVDPNPLQVQNILTSSLFPKIQRKSKISLTRAV
jgi:ABC-2 type transport system permease protein